MADISKDASMEQHRASQEGLGIGKLRQQPSVRAVTMGEKVVPLTQPQEKPPLTVVAADYSACQHHRYEVHHALPRVFCADCDTDLDPFWVLRRIAGDYSQRDYQVQHLKRESAKLEKLVR